jgi:hypothetical protein
MRKKPPDDRRFHSDVQLEQRLAAYRQAADALPWVRAQLGGQLSIGFCERGRLRDAASHAGIAWDHALDGQRLTQGIATAEVIAGYQQAAAARFAVETVTSGAVGLAHAIDEMVAVYRRSHDKTDEFNRHSVIALSNPGLNVVPEDIQAGEPSAHLALLQGRADEAVAILDRAFPRISDEHRGTRGYLALQVLRLEATSLSNAPWRDDDALTALQAIADDQDVRWLACCLARIHARLDLRSGRSHDALARLDRALRIASSWALGRYWLDLMIDRAALLRGLGHLDEARATARMLLIGEADDCSDWWPDPSPAPAGLHEGHRESILEGMRAFAGAEAEIEGLTQARASLDRVVTPTSLPKRRALNDDPDRPHTREEMHAQALDVLRARECDGTPFILYLTTFGLSVSHTASPFGPELLENSVLDAVPEGVNVIRIQEHSLHDDYASTAISVRRRAPALLLDDEFWKDVAEGLIATADLIISECYMLGPGVRFELERAYHLGRWDRTVLVLPPLQSYFAPVDNDPLIQMFPLCVWADELHTRHFFDLAVTRPMLERLQALAALRLEDLRELTTPKTRAAFMPVDYEAVARELTRDMQFALTFKADDDRTHYYSFWNLFRAAALRSVLFTRGEVADDVVFGLASNQLEMSAAMLNFEEKDDRVTFKGDLDNGEQMAISARALFKTLNHPFAAPMAEAAEGRIADYQNVRTAVAKTPERFRIAPIYGPFQTRSASVQSDAIQRGRAR